MMSSISGRNTRNSAFELCRIIAMLMIVACHFATHGGFSFTNTEITLPRLWWSFLKMGGNFGVDVFVLISGYFLIENKKTAVNFKKCLLFWGQLIFYSVVIFAFGILTHRVDFSVKSVAKAIMPITFNSWWFASTYFVMFLLHPYINRLLYSLEKKRYQKMLMLLGIMWCIIPTLTSSSYQANVLVEFFLLYSIAGYIKIHGLNPKGTSKRYLVFWLVLTAATYLSCVVLMGLGTRIALFSGRSTFFYGRTKLPTLPCAICFFMIFEKMPAWNNKAINTISSAAFGVYLLHDSSILRPMIWKDIFKNASYQDTWQIIPHSIFAVLAVYVVCSVIDLIRIYTVDILYRKAVDRYADPLIKPFSKASRWLSARMFGKE